MFLPVLKIRKSALCWIIEVECYGGYGADQDSVLLEIFHQI